VLVVSHGLTAPQLDLPHEVAAAVAITPRGPCQLLPNAPKGASELEHS
jgi:hypothetical protein